MMRRFLLMFLTRTVDEQHIMMWMLPAIWNFVKARGPKEAIMFTRQLPTEDLLSNPHININLSTTQTKTYRNSSDEARSERDYYRRYQTTRNNNVIRIANHQHHLHSRSNTWISSIHFIHIAINTRSQYNTSFLHPTNTIFIVLRIHSRCVGEAWSV